MSDYNPKHEGEVQPLLSDLMYNRLKELNMKVLPAFAALYAALAVFWDFPNGEQVVGTTAAVTVAISVLLTWANKRYEASGVGYDGSIEVQELDGRKVAVMDLPKAPADMIEQKTVVLKVNNS